MLFINVPQYFSGESAVFLSVLQYLSGESAMFLNVPQYFSGENYHSVSITEVGIQISIKRHLWVGGIQLSTFHEFRPKHRMLVRYLLGRA